MTIEFILERRSVRTYSGEPVSGDQITRLLEAAMAAPSAKNRQPWHFVVVTDKETLKKLSEAHPYGKMLAGAAAAIAVCGDMNTAPDYWIQDCSAATENILIAVAALGLGAVWLGCHPRPERVEAIRGVLGIPAHIGVLSLISIGHPAETKEPRTQYDESRVHRETW
ncbi:MAG TPA: nitroreductase family protein [Candidatus Eisenbacteria bacterium]|uniref:Nitroreductase family protein n=1 Tax=Eiseniibacteriota bacterium TaxID=2212470 RepID=A0A7V2AW53_UNCEI|nr:nitroreductase family protein [Candidatus Eisenbacteria bacterium]